MLVYDMIVDERRRAADLLAGLTPEQLRQQSLCDAWTIHGVAAHLVSFLRAGQAKIYGGMLATAGDFGPVTIRLAQWYGRRSIDDLTGLLRRRASARTTVPRSGYDPVLADCVLHDLDMRIPLGIARTIPEERLWVTFHHLTTVPSAGFAIGARLRGLSFEATDTGWRSGTGAPVRGGAEALVLGISGRAVAFADLEGDGAALLRDRAAEESRIPPGRRMAEIVRTLAQPSPRRSRQIEPPPGG